MLPTSILREEKAVFWFQLVVVAAVLFGVAAVAAGRGGSMAEAYPDRPDPALPADRPLTGEDLAGLRFGVCLRGYRMAEVDQALRRMAAELAARDARIGELEASGARTAVLQAPDARIGELASRDARISELAARDTPGNEPDAGDGPHNELAAGGGPLNELAAAPQHRPDPAPEQDG